MSDAQPAMFQQDGHASAFQEMQGDHPEAGSQIDQRDLQTSYMPERMADLD